MTPSELQAIRKRWGNPAKESQYHADVHALADEVERLQNIIACNCDDEMATDAYPCPVEGHH